MKVTAELGRDPHARIDCTGIEGGTYTLTIDDIDISGSLEDIEDVMDNLQHDLMLLKTGRRAWQAETLPMPSSAA